jgi:hypothetical protein
MTHCTKINKIDPLVVINDNILWCDIPVNNRGIKGMDIVKGCKKAFKDFFCLINREALAFFYLPEKVSAIDIFLNQDKEGLALIFCFKIIIVIGYKGIVDFL